MTFSDDFFRSQFLGDKMRYYHIRRNIQYKLSNWIYTMNGIWRGHKEAKGAIKEYRENPFRRNKHFTISSGIGH